MMGVLHWADVLQPGVPLTLKPHVASALSGCLPGPRFSVGGTVIYRAEDLSGQRLQGSRHREAAGKMRRRK